MAVATIKKMKRYDENDQISEGNVQSGTRGTRDQWDDSCADEVAKSIRFKALHRPLVFLLFFLANFTVSFCCGFRVGSLVVSLVAVGFICFFFYFDS